MFLAGADVVFVGSLVVFKAGASVETSAVLPVVGVGARVGRAGGENGREGLSEGSLLSPVVNAGGD
jgi:hypothetical protein